MTRKTLAAAAVVALVAVSACTRGSAAGSNATPAQVYGASPTQGEVQGVLGSPDWWVTTPSFLVRPLGLPNMPENLKFAIAEAYVHVGTPEILRVQYSLYTTTSDATTAINNEQSAQTNTATTPKVGDQSLYYGYRLATHTALYSTFATVRLGLFVINIDYDKDSGFADFGLMAKIATKAVNRLKDVVAGKVHPTPLTASDSKLLPPAGPDVTIVGSARLPIDALAATIATIGTPQQVVDAYNALGVKDFLYGDFAVDADLTMEVKTHLFTFNSPSDATTWIEAAAPAGSIDPNGVSFTYSAASGEYVAFFVAGTYGGIAFCLATTPNQAASRACEAPVNSLITAWQLSLSSL